jgi:hypothetical protein
MDDVGYPARLVEHHVKTYFPRVHDPFRSLHYYDIPFSFTSDTAIHDYARRAKSIVAELKT